MITEAELYGYETLLHHKALNAQVAVPLLIAEIRRLHAEVSWLDAALAEEVYAQKRIAELYEAGTQPVPEGGTNEH